MKICFVCFANVCRSFMAQELLKKFILENNISNIEVISRGTFALSYLQVPQKIKDFLEQNDITYHHHTPTLISKQDIEQSDLVFVMTKEQQEELIDIYAQHTDKIHLLLDYCYNKEEDVLDPISKEGRAFIKIANNLKDAIEILVEKLLNHKN